MPNCWFIQLNDFCFIYNSNFKSQLFNMPLVTKPIYKFDCHEGEVNAIKYHKSGKYFATGGGDRKIKLWEFRDGKCELMSTLIGSNAAIASIDIDNEVKYLNFLLISSKFKNFPKLKSKE